MHEVQGSSAAAGTPAWQCLCVPRIPLTRPSPSLALPQELPASFGKLQRLKLLQLDGNQIAALPPALLRGCTSLATISLHGNPITPEALQQTDGFAEFEARRRNKYTKTLATGVLLGPGGLDEGVDRATTRAR